MSGLDDSLNGGFLGDTAILVSWRTGTEKTISNKTLPII